jgi:NADP-dependent 3-hydroxy acid dehydrogenase YdfG
MTDSLGTALITGASSGIGAVYADRLAKRGYDLILVARNSERLNSLSTRLTAETARSVTVLPADLGDKSALARVEAVLRDDSSIAMLVNNAGVASRAPLLEADVEEMEAMIAVNVTALTRLTYAARAPFVARGSGTIVSSSPRRSRPRRWANVGRALPRPLNSLRSLWNRPRVRGFSCQSREPKEAYDALRTHGACRDGDLVDVRRDAGLCPDFQRLLQQ